MTSARRRKQENNDASARKPPKTNSKKTGVSKEPSICSKCLQYLLYILIALVIPSILNHAALQKEFTILKEEGLLYDIGWEQKLYVKCTGKNGPTVILEAPAGKTSDVWYRIQPLIAEHTRVCSYDRAGLGFSDSSHKNLSAEDQKRRGQESTVERMAEDLHQFLAISSTQPKPYVLVGAEMGALITRFYAQMHPADVSDIVLIEPMSEFLFEEESNIWQQFWFQHLVPSAQMMQFCSAIGLTRLGLLLGIINQPITEDGVHNTTVMRQKHLMCSPSHQSAAVDEYFFINESISQVRTAFKVRPFSEDISVNIVNGNYHDESLPSQLNEAWSAASNHLKDFLHPRAKVTTVNGSDGKMIYKNPEPIVHIIKKLIKKNRDKFVRNGSGSIKR